MVDGWYDIWVPKEGEATPHPEDEDFNTRTAHVTVESYEKVWKKRGFVPVEEVEEDEVPDSVADIMAWINDAPNEPTKRARAETALRVEQESDNPRKTVVEKAEAVLNAPPPNDVPVPDKES